MPGDVIDMRRKRLERMAPAGEADKLVILDCIEQGLAIEQLWPGVAEHGKVETFMRMEPVVRFVIRSAAGEEREFRVSELPDVLRHIRRVGELPKGK